MGLESNCSKINSQFDNSPSLVKFANSFQLTIYKLVLDSTLAYSLSMIQNQYGL